MEGRQITTSTKQIPKAQPLVLNVEDGTSLALDNDRYRDTATPSFSPLATTLAEHTTPQLVYLQARFAAVMSYAQAGALLGEVLPLGRTVHPSGVRVHLHQVATRLEAELGAEDTAGVGGCPRDWDALPRPDMPLTVGLDGGYGHSSTQISRKDGWFEVVAGKSMSTDGESKCFAFVQKIETKPRRRLFEVLSAQGMAANQSVTFLTDGAKTSVTCPCTSIRRLSTTWTGSTSPCGSP